MSDNFVRRKGTSPNTSTVISSKVKIYAGQSGTEQIGLIANFDPSESRSAEPVRGIGFGDQIAELVPGMTDAISISVGRTAQYLSNLFSAFGYKGGINGMVRSLKHHRWPFDIKQEIVVSWLANGAISSSPDQMSSDTTFDRGGDTGVTVTYGESVSGTDSDTVTTTKKTLKTAPLNTSLHAIKTIYEACWFTDFSTSFTSDTTIVQETGTVMCSDVYNDLKNASLATDASANSSSGTIFSGLNLEANSGALTNRVAGLAASTQVASASA